MKIAVVILNFNGKSHLEKFLPSVIKYSDNAEIIIADNGSTDDSVSFLKKNFPHVKVLEFTVNSGFAGGYNKALQKISADYYVLLNSDVEVTENWMEPIIERMEKDKSIAAAQPKIKSFSEKNKFEYAGAAGGFIDRYGYPFCRGRIFDSIEIDNGQYDDEKQIFWATGACMFVKAELFHKSGGFDSDFFAHMEEIDLCWRLINSGYKIFYLPYSAVYHQSGGTLPKSNPKKTYLNFRNNLIMLLKNLPVKKLFFVLLIRFFLDGIAIVKFIFQRKTKDAWAVKKAYLYIIWNIFFILNKRKKFFLTVSELPPPFGGANSQLIYPRSIVWDYFVRKKKKFCELNFNI